jgi:PAS domain S-box-containing protein
MNLSWGMLHAGLQTVLDTALDAVIVMNDEGCVVGWNGNAQRTFGWTAEEALGARLSDLLIPDRYREAHERGLAHFLATGEGPVLDRHFEIEGVTRDGIELPIELSITATEQFGDRVFVGFLRDISERRAEAERQQRILQESEHRVKNMLTVVAAIAQQTARVSPDMDSFSKAFAGRLESLARAHELLVGQVWRDIALSALAERVLGADVALGRARFGGPEILLKPGQVLGLSMILHELYTNAIKYGALCNDGRPARRRLGLRGRNRGAHLEGTGSAVRLRFTEQRLRQPDDRDECQIRPQGHDRAGLEAGRPHRRAAVPQGRLI